jgi:hypothetical protein
MNNQTILRRFFPEFLALSLFLTINHLLENKKSASNIIFLVTAFFCSHALLENIPANDRMLILFKAIIPLGIGATAMYQAAGVSYDSFNSFGSKTLCTLSAALTSLVCETKFLYSTNPYFNKKVILLSNTIDQAPQESSQFEIDIVKLQNQYKNFITSLKTQSSEIPSKTVSETSSLLMN